MTPDQLGQCRQQVRFERERLGLALQLAVQAGDSPGKRPVADHRRWKTRFPAPTVKLLDDVGQEVFARVQAPVGKRPIPAGPAGVDFSGGNDDDVAPDRCATIPPRT